MAVFMLNVCKFNGCGLTFKSLGHLIQHIEETHIDYDPHVVEQTELQQPTCIPLSYALRFLTDAARKEGLKPVGQGRLSRDTSGVNFTAATRSRNNAATPTGSEAEEGDEFVSEPEDSNDSWTTSEEFSADFILRYGGSRVINPGAVTPTTNSGSGNSNSSDKPFACPVPGCKKRYKNVNGIKYHSKNGHKNDGKIRKAFRCPCGKSYKTPYGLKNHASIQHAGTVLQIKLLQNGKSTTSSSAKSDNNSRENSSKTVPPLKIGKQALAKAKIAAIEDHGYIKSEKTIYAENGGDSTTTTTTATTAKTSTARDCEDDDLGILTPASTPPLSSQSPEKTEILNGNSQQQSEQRSLHKYLANVVASAQNGQNRRDVVENNAY